MKKVRPWLPPVIALLWLGQLELACSPEGGVLSWLSFAALTLALGIETVMLWVRREPVGPKAAIVLVGGAVLPVALLDFTLYSLVHNETSLRVDPAAAAFLRKGGTAGPVCSGCEVLWHDEHTWLLGQPRTEWYTCVYGIREFDPSEPGDRLMPPDFPAYERLVDPHLKDDGLALGRFLSWQYPRRRFALIAFEDGVSAPHVSTAVETNR
jgi:hypothetical protein